MLEQQKSAEKFTKEKVAVLLLWFGVLIGIRTLLGFMLENMWVGIMGAVAVTFVIFYATLRYIGLQKASCGKFPSANTCRQLYL